MPLKTWIVRIAAAILITVTSLTAVGLTAPADAAFSITIRPVWNTLGVQVVVKVWKRHLHFGWSAIAAADVSTNVPGLSL